MDDENLRNGRVFAELVDPTTGNRTSADGMRCDIDGNVWAGARRNRLFMTASQSLYSVYVGVRGAGYG